MMPKARARECGDCIVCCVYPRVDELQKPLLTHCRHLNLSLPVQENTCQYTSEREKKCSIYTDRPETCRKYYCMWRLGYGAEEDRPDRCGILVDTNHRIENGIEAKPLGPGYEDKPEAIAAVNRMCQQRGCPALVTDFYERNFKRIVGRPPEPEESP